MEWVRLGDVALKITKGTTPTSVGFDFVDKGINFIKIESISEDGVLIPTNFAHISEECNNKLKRSQLEENDILFSIAGAIGRVAVVKRDVLPANTNQALAIIRVPDSIDCSFLACALRSPALFVQCERQKQGVAQINLSLKNISDFLIPRLSLDEQRRIAAVLDKVSDLIAKRRQQLEKLDELVKARFVEMFGDFKTNPMGWPIVPFREIAKIDANMTMDFDKYANYPHIGIENIEKTTGTLRGYKTVAEDNVLSGKYIFTHKHIIYSKLRPNLNKVALPDFDGVCSSDAYPILPFEEKCNRIFLAHNMRSNFFLDYIVKLCGGTNLPRVNRKEILDFQTPLPPVELQSRFATFVGRAEKVKKCTNWNLGRLEILKKALMQRYFE